jgi:hypothetical protein
MAKIVRVLVGVALWTAIVAHPASLFAQAEAPPLPERSELVRVVDFAEDGRLELVVGPVSLPAGGPHLRAPVQLVTLPIEGWLHGFEWEMRDAAGEPLSDRLLHHVNFIDPDNRELFAPIARRVMAAGRETQRERMPKFLGYPIASGTRFLISAMFASLEEQGHDEAFLHVTLSYSPQDAGLFAPRAVYPFYLDVMGPVGEKDFPVPPGVTTMSWEGRPAIEGRIFAIGGHLHNYGEWIRLEDVTEGKVVWETEPEVNEQGEVMSVPTGKLWWRGGVKLFPDHLYRITVQYNNPNDMEAMDGGMGALGGILYAPDAVWPELDRSDVAYAEDLRNTLEKPNQAHEHGHGEMEHEHGPAQESTAAEHEHGGPRR